jgi:hypothetical protein
VSFATITLCVPSERVFIVIYFVRDSSENFWINPHMFMGPVIIGCTRGEVDVDVGEWSASRPGRFTEPPVPTE